VSLNQGESKDFNIVNRVPSDQQQGKDDKYNIIVVSQNAQIHQALGKTLQHFSLNGKGIHIFNASGLQEAQVVAGKHPDIILVVIDDNVQMNGSYAIFVDFIRKTLGNKNCCITFKENLINTNTCDKKEVLAKDESYSGFFYARERLIDITRMVMMTTEMESKISNRNLIDSKLDAGFQENYEESSQFTKEKLYTVMAHDLKEPVGNIKVMLDFLTNEPELLDKQTSKDLLHRVRESANNIHELLEDFLFWGRIFKQDIYFNPGKADIGQITRENVLLLKSTAAEKKIGLKSEVPEQTFAFADEYMINTVIRNLVYNAIKFTEKKGNVTITAELKNDVVKIHVKDNGIGIPKDNLRKLFKADVYLSTAGTEKESGAGLGLVLCKDFIERNGGSLSIESEEGKGSTIIFTLPVWSFA